MMELVLVRPLGRDKSLQKLVGLAKVESLLLCLFNLGLKTLAISSDVKDGCSLQ